MKKQLFLITNDDGVQAEGIHCLARVAEMFGDVYVVAPDRDRSACSHALTVAKPLFCQKKPPLGRIENVYSVDGTPVDCVRLAIKHILPHRPLVVLSGINRGSNIGSDVLYSGTVAAAMEASRHGCSAIAFSGSYDKQDTQYDTCERVVHNFLTSLDKLNFNSKVLNINIPALNYSELRGIKTASLGQVKALDGYHEYKDPKGKTQYWLGEQSNLYEESLTSDYFLNKQGYVTVSALGIDVLDHEVTKKVELSLPQLTAQ